MVTPMWKIRQIVYTNNNIKQCQCTDNDSVDRTPFPRIDELFPKQFVFGRKNDQKQNRQENHRCEAKIA